jgi:hypothetical protein
MHLCTPGTALRAGCGPQNHPQAIIAISFPEVKGVNGSSGHKLGTPRTISNEVLEDVTESTMLLERARKAGFCRNALAGSAKVNKLTGTKSFITM